MSTYDSGFARAQAAYDNATPEDRWVFVGDDEDEPDPDDLRDRQYDAAMASDWDTAPVDSGLTGDDWGGPSPLDD